MSLKGPTISPIESERPRKNARRISVRSHHKYRSISEPETPTVIFMAIATRLDTYQALFEDEHGLVFQGGAKSSNARRAFVDLR